MNKIWYMIVLCFTDMLSAAEMVSNFAPMKIGNTWEYQYDSVFTPFDYPMSHDSRIIVSLTIRMEVTSSVSFGSDTMFRLNVTENGVQKAITIAPAETTSTSITKSFTDSLICRNDSIFFLQGFQSIISPCFITNSITQQEGMTRVKVGNDSLYQFADSALHVLYPTRAVQFVYRYECFLQNIGCMEYSYRYKDLNMCYTGVLIKLLRFNGRAIVPTSIVTNSSINRSMYQVKSAYTRTINFNSNRYTGTSPRYLVSGKCIERRLLDGANLQIITRRQLIKTPE